MGRPLNKKYFGNRNPGLDGNFGAQNTAGDAGLGGTGVASIDVTYPGDGWTTQPTYTVAIPSLPDGVRAEVTPHYQALSFDTTANGTGYKVGDVLQVDTGSGSIEARAAVASILSIGTPGITNGGTMYDINSPTDGDKITFSHANLQVSLRVRVTAVSGSTATQIVVEQAGVWIGAGAPPTSMANGVNGFTATTTAKTGGDTNGNGLVLSFSAANWGVYSFGSPTRVGDYTSFPSTGGAGTLTSISPATGTGAKADISMGLLSVHIDNPGTGYVVGWSTDNIWTESEPFVNFSGTSGQAPNYDVYAQRDGSADVNRGIFVYGFQAGVTQDSDITVPVDIIKQQSSRRYKVRERKWKTLTAANYGTLTANNTSGAFTIGTAQPAGTFVVGQMLMIQGSLGGVGGFDYYYPGIAYQITATNGTSTFTLELYGNPIVTTAGAITGAILASQTPHDTVVERSAQLVGRWPAAHDEIAIIATDNNYSLYFVTKLTAHRALLVPVDYFNDQWHFPANEPGTWPDGVYRSAAWTIDPSKVFGGDDGEEKVLIGNYDIFSGP